MSIVITGANRGIGLALVEHYSARGETLVATTRKSNSQAPDSGSVRWLELDVNDENSLAEFADRLAGTPVSLVVCNAGVYPDKNQNLSDGYAAALWQEAFQTNVTGVFLTIQKLLPNLRKATAPKITPKIAIISSKMATSSNAPGGSYIYRASKAAVLNMGRNLAVDLKPLGIAVGIYHPGWVRTEMGSNSADISVEASASGLIERFDALSLEASGCFESYEGEALAF